MQAKNIVIGETYEVTSFCGRHYRGQSFKATCTGTATWPHRWPRYQSDEWKDRAVYCSDNEVRGFAFTHTPTSGPNAGVEQTIYASARYVYRTWAEREAAETRATAARNAEQQLREELWRQFYKDTGRIKRELGIELSSLTYTEYHRQHNRPPTSVKLSIETLLDACEHAAP